MATFVSIILIFSTVCWVLTNVQSGNFSHLARDVQGRVFSRLNVLDRLNVRKSDKKRNEIIKSLHAGEKIRMKEMENLLRNVTDKNIHQRVYLNQIRSLIRHSRHTLPFHQAIKLNVFVIQNNTNLSAKNKKLLMNVMNITRGKCMFCFENGNQGYCCSHYVGNGRCSYCAPCLKQWIQNKTRGIRCPICGGNIDKRVLNDYETTNEPFANSQPGYSITAETNCCGARMDISNGCIIYFHYCCCCRCCCFCRCCCISK